jgi:hypothetical protein
VRERIIWWALGSAFIAAMGLPLVFMVRHLQRASTLTEHGLVTTGIVVDGESGSSMDNAPYCVENIDFNVRGRVYRTRRECVSNPNPGERVQVHYAAANPNEAYVEDDYRSDQMAFALIVFVLGFIWMLVPRRSFHNVVEISVSDPVNPTQQTSAIMEWFASMEGRFHPGKPIRTRFSVPTVFSVPTCLPSLPTDLPSLKNAVSFFGRFRRYRAPTPFYLDQPSKKKPQDE